METTLTVRNCRFFYRYYYNYLAGAGPHNTIVLIHGHNRDGDDFAAIAPSLSRTHHVLVPDLRFHGRSECAMLDHPAGIADLAEDMHAILQALAIYQPILLGHSLGGMIALDYWRQFPHTVRALVIDDSFPNFQAGIHLLGNLFAPTVDPALQSRIMAKSETNQRAGHVPASVWDSILAFDARPWLTTIDVPTLALLGDRGWVDAAQRDGVLQAIGTALIPHVRVETFQDCGHFIALEQPERYCAVLGEFLRRFDCE